MTSQFYARAHALICTHPKAAFSAPHSTSSPHLAQTEQDRLMRFFALPDSNTSQRVTISVLGHVVVSQMDIVQVPYATVTVKYFRALTFSQLLPTAHIETPGVAPTNVRPNAPPTHVEMPAQLDDPADAG